MPTLSVQVEAEIDGAIETVAGCRSKLSDLKLIPTSTPTELKEAEARLRQASHKLRETRYKAQRGTAHPQVVP